MEKEIFEISSIRLDICQEGAMAGRLASQIILIEFLGGLVY